jgi:hypothetical protein
MQEKEEALENAMIENEKLKDEIKAYSERPAVASKDLVSQETQSDTVIMLDQACEANSGWSELEERLEQQTAECVLSLFFSFFFLFFFFSQLESTDCLHLHSSDLYFKDEIP